jgi:vitamin B12 transporter
MLQGRSEYFGRVEASRRWGAWSLSGGVTASAERYDSANEAPASRLPGYAIADAAVRYTASKDWNLEFTATNLFDKRYEHAVGYDAPRRSLRLNVRFETF